MMRPGPNVSSDYEGTKLTGFTDSNFCKTFFLESLYQYI